MAGKRPAKRFVIPDDEKLDNPIESFKKGSIFAGRNKNVEKTFDADARAQRALGENDKQSSLKEQKQEVQHGGNDPSGEIYGAEKSSANSVNVLSAGAISDATNVETINK